jgi:hypothetical protein
LGFEYRLQKARLESLEEAISTAGPGADETQTTAKRKLLEALQVGV